MYRDLFLDFQQFDTVNMCNAVGPALSVSTAVLVFWLY